MKALACMLACAVLLTACGEKDQTLNASASKRDEPAWKGAHDEFMARNWTPGDRNSWENQLRSRAQYQNEYAKVN